MNYLLVVIWIAMGFSAAAWLRKRGRYGDRLTYSAFWDILLPAVAGPALLLLARPWSELPGAGHLLTTGRARMKANVRQNFGTRDLIRIATLSLAALASLGTLLVLFMAWRTIEPGYVGIVFDKASRRVTNTLDPGWTFINPFTQSITRYPVSLQTLVMVKEDMEGKTKGDDSVRVGSKEGQVMHADVSIQYSVERGRAAEVYSVWAGAPIERIEDNLVRQVTRSVLNDIASQYGWEEIYGAKRIEYTQKVSNEIARRFTEKHIKFEALNLRGWHLPDALQKLVEQVIAAQQAREQQQFALEQARIKAEQDKVTAEGQANALRQQAQGEADARRTRAQADADATRVTALAQAEANEQLARSVTADLIRYQQVQKWDGKVPVFNGGNATPLVDITGMTSATPR